MKSVIYSILSVFFVLSLNAQSSRNSHPVFVFSGNTEVCAGDDLDITATLVSYGFVTGLHSIKYEFYYKSFYDSEYILINNMSDYGTVSMTVRGQGQTYETIPISSGSDYFGFQNYIALTLGVLDSYCVSRNRPIRIDMNFDVSGFYKIAKKIYSCSGTGSFLWTSYTCSGPIPPCPSGTQSDKASSSCSNETFRSNSEIEFIVHENPEAPFVSEIIHPTCADHSAYAELSGLPAGDWAITVYPGENEIIGNTASVIVSGLTADNSYSFSVFSDNTGCNSVQSEPILINGVPSPPAVPQLENINHPSCANPLGSIILNEQNGVEYSIDGIQWHDSEVFGELSPGYYTVQARSNDDITCISAETEVIEINDVPDFPEVPQVASVEQADCINMFGKIIATPQEDVEFSINGEFWQISEHFDNLNPGSYLLRVRSIEDNTCVSYAIDETEIFPIENVPLIPLINNVTHPDCLIETGVIVVEVQEDVDYSLDGLVWQESEVFEDVLPGEYFVSVRNVIDNNCISSNIEAIFINEIPDNPEIPQVEILTQPTCLEPEAIILFSGLPNENWTITILPGSDILQGNTTSASFGGFIPEESFTFYVTVDANHCSSTETDVITVNPLPEVPVQPSAIEGSDAVCEGSTQFYSVQSDPQVNAYEWILPDTWTGIEISNSIEVAVGNLSGILYVAAINDCGSSVPSQLEVTVIPKPDSPQITNAGFLLSSDSETGNQWYWNGHIIEGAENQDYLAQEDGEYFAIVTIDGCSSEPSNNIQVLGTASNLLTSEHNINIFPNPVSDILNIKNISSVKILEFRILSTEGKTLLNFSGNLESVDVSSLANGSYILELKAQEFIKRLVFVKDR